MLGHVRAQMFRCNTRTLLQNHSGLNTAMKVAPSLAPTRSRSLAPMRGRGGKGGHDNDLVSARPVTHLATGERGGGRGEA